MHNNESEERILRTFNLDIKGIGEIQTLCEYVSLTFIFSRDFVELRANVMQFECDHVRVHKGIAPMENRDM